MSKIQGLQSLSNSFQGLNVNENTDLSVKIYTDLGLQKIVEFKDFSRLLSGCKVIFKTDLIFNDFSRKPSKFKYFSSVWEP